ncbi:MAG TPA: hypothetical protein VGM98_22365, partial [Schlesneria sp.]
MKTTLARRAATFTLAAMVLCSLIYSTQITAAPKGPATPTAYRVETTAILDRDDAKLVKIRVESGVAFYATVDHGEGHTSSTSKFDPASKSHHVDIVLLFDHITSHQCVKELLTVGAAGGPSVQSVPLEYKLNDNIKAKVTDG